VAAYSRALELDPMSLSTPPELAFAAQTSSPGDRAEYFYLLARMYAKSGSTERSLSYLRRANGGRLQRTLTRSCATTKFAAVRNDPRFSALMSHKPSAITE